MALDQEYFESIQLSVVKKKYYNANKVDAVLKDIYRQALAMGVENERLRQQADMLLGRKDEIGDTLLSAKTISQQIIREAEEKADQILAEARDRSRELLLAESEREEAMRCRMEEYVQRIRDHLLDCAEEISDEWHGFENGEEAAPDDLEEKVGAIARQLFADEDGE